MVTLPSGGLTVLSVSSALQGTIFQASGKCCRAKKNIFFQILFSSFLCLPPLMPDTLAISIFCSITPLHSYL